jgi:hypothetical protein
MTMAMMSEVEDEDKHRVPQEVITDRPKQSKLRRPNVGKEMMHVRNPSDDAETQKNVETGEKNEMRVS